MAARFRGRFRLSRPGQLVTDPIDEYYSGLPNDAVVRRVGHREYSARSSKRRCEVASFNYAAHGLMLFAKEPTVYNAGVIIGARPVITEHIAIQLDQILQISVLPHRACSLP